MLTHITLLCYQISFLLKNSSTYPYRSLFFEKNQIIKTCLFHDSKHGLASWAKRTYEMAKKWNEIFHKFSYASPGYCAVCKNNILRVDSLLFSCYWPGNSKLQNLWRFLFFCSVYSLNYYDTYGSLNYYGPSFESRVSNKKWIKNILWNRFSELTYLLMTSTSPSLWYLLSALLELGCLVSSLICYYPP